MDRSVDPVVLRLRVRGGKWGCRALRLALALHDNDHTGRCTASQTVAALEKFGVRGVSRAQLEGFLRLVATADAVDAVPSSVDLATMTFGIEPMMDVVLGGPLAFERHEAILRCLRALKSRRSSKSLGTAWELTTHANLVAHPDVASGLVTLREALVAFFTSFGVERDSIVSDGLFVRTFADWSVGFPDCRDFTRFIFGIFEVCGADGVSAGVPLPTRAETDRVFHEIDANANGALSLAELDLACARLWPAWNLKAALMRAYKLADSSGNGMLDQNEFHRFCQYLPVYADLLRKFQALDSDRTGTLTLDELKANRASLGLQSLNDVQMRAAFKEIDTNGGGKVVFEEFAMWMARRLGNEFMARRTNEFAAGDAQVVQTGSGVVVEKRKVAIQRAFHRRAAGL